MTEKPGIGDCNVSFELGGRPITLRFSPRVALAITSGVGLDKRIEAIRVLDLASMAEMIQIASGGRYDDHGISEPFLTLEDIYSGMVETGYRAIAIPYLDRFLYFVMTNGKPLNEAKEVEKKPDPQPEG